VKNDFDDDSVTVVAKIPQEKANTTLDALQIEIAKWSFLSETQTQAITAISVAAIAWAFSHFS
jgi:hypothetical protein